MRDGVMEFRDGLGMMERAIYTRYVVASHVKVLMKVLPSRLHLHGRIQLISYTSLLIQNFAHPNIQKA